MKQFTHLLKTEMNDLEEHAGIPRFANYSFFATLRHKTGGYPTSYDTMIQVPAHVFYTTLTMGNEVEEYQQNLKEIRQRVNQFED